MRAKIPASPPPARDTDETHGEATLESIENKTVSIFMKT